MAELNKYSLYAGGAMQIREQDKVDKFISDLKEMNEYEEVCTYLEEHFGENQKSGIIEFPELNKQISIVYKDNAVEFCAAKNRKQYFGKGWLFVNDEKLLSENK